MNINKGNVLCVIPARGGSKSIKKKNIAKLNGKPLIAYTILEAQKVFPKENISIGDFIKVKIDDCTSATLLGKKC